MKVIENREFRREVFRDDTVIEDVTYKGCSFIDCVLEDITLRNVHFEDCVFYDNIMEIIAMNVSFKKCDIQDNEIKEGSFSKSSFKDCGIKGMLVHEYVEGINISFTDCELLLNVSADDHFKSRAVLSGWSFIRCEGRVNIASDHQGKVKDLLLKDCNLRFDMANIAGERFTLDGCKNSFSTLNVSVESFTVVDCDMRLALSSGTFSDSRFKHSTLRNSKIWLRILNSSFSDCDLNRLKVSGTLEEVGVSNCSVIGAWVDRLTISGCVFSSTDFSGAELESNAIKNTIIDECRGKGARIGKGNQFEGIENIMGHKIILKEGILK